MFRSCTEQEKATAASLRVAWILGKNLKTFTDLETVKDCMLAVVQDIVTEDKTRNNKIPMFATSTTAPHVSQAHIRHVC